MLLNIASQPRRKNMISLTPLIDVVFILLLFFMLSSTFTRWYQVELPTPSVSESQTPDISVLTLLSNTGDITTGKQQLKLTDLVGLQQFIATKPDAVWVLNAQKGVSVQTVITTLDNLKQAGANRVSFAGLAQ
jgi:biopolymer transport protein ExbD